MGRVFKCSLCGRELSEGEKSYLCTEQNPPDWVAKFVTKIICEDCFEILFEDALQRSGGKQIIFEKRSDKN